MIPPALSAAIDSPYRSAVNSVADMALGCESASFGDTALLRSGFPGRARILGYYATVAGKLPLWQSRAGPSVCAISWKSLARGGWPWRTWPGPTWRSELPSLYQSTKCPAARRGARFRQCGLGVRIGGYPKKNPQEPVLQPENRVAPISRDRFSDEHADY